METAALILLTLAGAFHAVSTALAIYRFRLRRSSRTHWHTLPPVSLIRPVCGLDPMDEMTLGSTFGLGHAETEILFCSAREHDAAVPLVRRLIASHPDGRARLLVGDDRSTPNPKLNNVIKGWDAASHRWIAIADSNVLMPRDYVERLFDRFEADTGLVCSPPVGSHPAGFWAEVECGFLNTYQARWQYAADTLGFGFAQGKSMLWRRDVLDAQGGILRLGIELAEDAAATKIVRARGLRVRLVDRPFLQPLGRRNRKDVTDRQVRWARLRRATFPLCYAPEVLTGSVAPMMAAALAAPAMGIGPALAVAITAVVWFATEALLARAAGWHLSLVSPAAWLVRDLMLPAVWLEGWIGDAFTWRGTDMSVADTTIASPEGRA